MKKSSFVLIALFILLFSACKKEEESVKEQITGPWRYESIKIDYYEGGEFVRNEENNPPEAFINFKSDGDYNISQLSNILERGTWEMAEKDTKILMGPEGRNNFFKLSILELRSDRLILLDKNGYTENGTDYSLEAEIILIR